MYGRGQHQQQHRVVVLDNGAGSIKLGCEGEINPRLVFPNCTAKAKGERQVYVGDGLLEARELGGMLVRRPHDRGFLVNADLERDIWAKGFASLAASLAGGGAGSGTSGSSRSKAVLDYRSYSLLLTEPLFNFDAVRGVTEEIVFEEFGFNSLLAAPSPWFSLHYACSQPVVLPPPGLHPQAAAALFAQQQFNQQQQLGLPTASGQPLSAAAIAAGNAAKAAGTGLIVDAGFSSCYVAPFFDGQLLSSGIRRLNLGGKALTNLLKETVSYRSLNMSDEGLLMERLKDQLCWVSQDAAADLRRANPAARSPHRRDVVLPDGVHNLRGYVRPPGPDMAEALKPGGKFSEVALGPWPEKPQHLQDMEAAAAAKKPGGGTVAGDAAAVGAGSSKGGGKGGGGGGGPAVVDQVLSLNNELFMVPEALFRPSDIGLAQAGLPEVVTQSVAACPAGLAPLLYGQVVLTGGCCNLPGFAARFEAELRRLVPDELELLVLAPQDPELAAWRGASVFAAGDNYWQCVRTRKQYNETGPSGGSSRRDRGIADRSRDRGRNDDDDDDDDDSDSF